MTHAKRWLVRPSKFPFGVADKALGVVTGETRDDAEKKAKEYYGQNVIVELAHGAVAVRLNSSDRSGIAPTAHVVASRRLANTLRAEPAVMRPMTADEAQMARWVACCDRLRGHRHRVAMRMLHARSLTDARTISQHEAATLRAVVLELRAELPEHIVALAGGAA